MRNQHKADSPQTGFHWIGREHIEVFNDVRGIAIELSAERGKEILQAPACHHGIEAEDDRRGEDA